MTKSNPQTLSATKPAVIVFGLDQAGKPKAGRFAERHAAAARKAAKSLKLSICSVTKPGIAGLVGKIPVGRVHAQGKAFIPYIKRELFDQVQAASATTTALAAKAKPGSAITATPVAKPPRNWDDIAQGHLVLYQEGPRDGWWESIVMAREGESLTLKYRDFPRLPSFQCHFRAVALTFVDPE
jgi:hypothetical protein